MSETVRHLPSVDRVLSLETTQSLMASHDRGYVLAAIRQVLQRLRGELLAAGDEGGSTSREDLLARVAVDLAAATSAAAQASLHRVINATGVILHTGLGRAPLPHAAREAVWAVSDNYCNLEFDLDSGQRGSRRLHVEAMICEQTGAAAAAVVNNNAAAVLLMLSSLARDREVIISRGELVEIGGAFRIPDIIAASGARLREVGTTNRTHLSDYENALNTDTAMILAVHPSNYRVQGFTATVELSELAALGRRAGVPLVYDLGGGVIVDPAAWGLPEEPRVADSLARGADLVSFSGDKVLGGPQAGIIAGDDGLVHSLSSNPMMRALRCDKLTLAALEATLRLYRLDAAGLAAAHPVLRMMTEAAEVVTERAERLCGQLSATASQRLNVRVEATASEVGSGALPLAELPSAAVSLRPAFCSVEELARLLRCGGTAVVGRIHREAVLLDMRTVRDDELSAVAAALEIAASEH